VFKVLRFKRLAPGWTQVTDKNFRPPTPPEPRVTCPLSGREPAAGATATVPFVTPLLGGEICYPAQDREENSREKLQSKEINKAVQNNYSICPFSDNNPAPQVCRGGRGVVG